MNNIDLTQALKSLDVAPEEEVDDVVRRRADARKEQIIAESAPPLTRVPPGTTHRPWRVAVAGLATAAAAGIILASTLTPDSAAYASWTATPTSVTASERALAGKACVDSAQVPSAKVVLAERRGDWIGIAAITPEPAVASCLVYLPTGATSPGPVTSGVGGGQGAIPSAGQFTDGAISEFRGTGFLGIGASPGVAFNIGDVGPDVTDVDIITVDGQVVHATVDEGRFIAWWPGQAFGDKKEGNRGPAPDLRYRLTLTDGTVLNDAEPTLPE